jgi:hypothetical protein
LPRSVVLSYFEPRELATIVAAVRRARLPQGTPLFIGSYGVGDRIAARVHELPHARYAPMFHIQPGWFWERAPARMTWSVSCWRGTHARPAWPGRFRR